MNKVQNAQQVQRSRSQVIDWLGACDFHLWAEAFWRWVHTSCSLSLALQVLHDDAPHLAQSVAALHPSVQHVAHRPWDYICTEAQPAAAVAILPHMCRAQVSNAGVPGQLRTKFEHSKQVMQLLQAAADTPAITSIRATVQLRWRQSRQREAAVMRRLMPAAKSGKAAPELHLKYVDDLWGEVQEQVQERGARQRQRAPHIMRMCWHMRLAAPRLRALQLHDLQLRDTAVVQLVHALDAAKALTRLALLEDTGSTFSTRGCYALMSAMWALRELVDVRIHAVCHAEHAPDSQSLLLLESAIFSLPKLQAVYLLPGFRNLSPAPAHTMHMLADCQQLNMLALHRMAFPAITASEVAVVSTLTALQHLTLTCKGLAPGAAEALCGALAALPSLTELALSTNDSWSLERGGDTGGTCTPSVCACPRCDCALPAPVLSLPWLQHLRLSGGMRQRPPLLPCLQCCTKLQLYAQAGTLGGGPLRTQQVLGILSAVRLTSLLLSHTQMTGDDLRALLQSAGQLADLRQLHFGYASFDIATLTSGALAWLLPVLLSACISLQQLGIEDGPVGDGVMQAMCVPLANMPQMREVRVIGRHMEVDNHAALRLLQATAGKLPRCTVFVRGGYTDILDAKETGNRGS